jgi:hypothetical protein
MKLCSPAKPHTYFIFALALLGVRSGAGLNRAHSLGTGGLGARI